MALKAWSILLGVGALCACSSKPQGSGGFQPVAATGGDNSTDSGGSQGLFSSGGANGSGAGNGLGGDGTSTGGTLTAAQKCVGQENGAEAVPVDMYIMFDKSSSMNDAIPGGTVTWWQTAQAAVTNFVDSPKAVNMGVGLQFFPLNGVAPQSCMADYSTPAVEVGILPGNSPAIVAAIDKETADSFTPMGPALQGAINHMKAWGPAHPGRVPVVVLVTDGFPTECDPQDTTDLANLAKTAFTTDPVVRTFTVGLNQAGADNLNAIAKAGGTGSATLIQNGDIGSQFVDAMLGIATTPLQCNFDIPKPTPPLQLDYKLIDVQYTPVATGVPQEVASVGNLGNCALNNNEGWYYDNPPPGTPTKILICPGTCALFAAGTVGINLGCAPTTVIN